MKKALLTFGVIVLFNGILLVFCGEGRPKGILLERPLHGRTDSTTCYAEFKRSMLIALRRNDVILLRLYARIGSYAVQANDAYLSTIFGFRRRNEKLLSRLNKYTEHEEPDWNAFAYTLTFEVRELELAIRNFRTQSTMT